MKYTVYKIVNKANGKIYIGCHKTVDLEDGYMGSGKILKRAIDKYGIENFEKEILEVFDNPDDMFEMEAKLVNPDDPNSYNLKEGGCGGFDHIKHSSEFMSEIGKIGNKKFLERYRSDPVLRERCKQAKLPGARKGLKKIKEMYPNGTWNGKSYHTDESKRKISEANKKLVGEKNGSFGTMWITDGIESKKINKTDPVPEGWRKGRKMKVR